jgi:hypothetical protein
MGCEGRSADVKKDRGKENRQAAMELALKG